jgi:hypothetical protein
MSQILHIFKKDIRRHYPDILISLILLVLYAHYSLHTLKYSANDTTEIMYQLAAGYISFGLFLFWAFFIVRLVQDESLVGDRQWWITKPYVWWQLLLAKLLFPFVFISVPVFLVQLFLLHQFGFTILPNVLGVFHMQLLLALTLFPVCLLLGSLTGNIRQALIGVACALIAFGGLGWVNSLLPHRLMFGLVGLSGTTQSLLVILVTLAIMVWQFARRKTWHTRGAVIASVVTAALLSPLVSNRPDMEQMHPLITSKDAPVRFTWLPQDRTKSAGAPVQQKITFASLNMDVSGIAPGNMIQVDGLIIRMDSPTTDSKVPDWLYQRVPFWPEGGQSTFLYAIDRGFYERSKKKKVHIEIAATEYREAAVHEISINPDALAREGFGICEIPAHNTSFFACRRPFTIPGGMITFDPAKANCPPATSDQSAATTMPSHYFVNAGDGGIGQLLNPVVDYGLAFQPKPTLSNTVPGQPPVAQPMPRLCSGAPLRLAEPQLVRRFRIEVDVPNTRLQDLVGSGQSVPGEGAISIELRP